MVMMNCGAFGDSTNLDSGLWTGPRPLDSIMDSIFGLEFRSQESKIMCKLPRGKVLMFQLDAINVCLSFVCSRVIEKIATNLRIPCTIFLEAISSEFQCFSQHQVSTHGLINMNHSSSTCQGSGRVPTLLHV